MSKRGKGRAAAAHSHRRTCCPWCGNDLLFVAILRAVYEEATSKAKPRPTTRRARK
jgi:hypothetical protein